MVGAALPLLLTLSAAALAQDDEAAIETVTGGLSVPKAALPSGLPGSQAPDTVNHAARLDALAGPLNVDPALLHESWRGVELLYLRRYKDGKAHFDAMTTRWPLSGVGPAGNALLYQGMMMENFDFKWESQYNTHSSQAVQTLQAALKSPGAEPWERFLLGMMMGVESIHKMRKTDYFPALSRGLEAMEHLSVAQRLAPSFADAHLGDGLYLYWRSVVTLSHKALPSFGDARPEGIQKMQTVEREGVFLSPGATLGLAFTWIEERDTSRALEACQKNHRRYPDNVINNLVASRVHLSRRELTQSLKMLDEVLEDAPDNERAHYYYATVYLRMGRLDDAERALDKYLSFNLAPDQRAQALYRKGDVALRREHFSAARGHYEQSASLGYKPAAEKLNRLASLEQAAATR
ncbi:MAG: tetratricopeptide repeat protein [Deltaproteobacteria bacterium]|nr:tetratricopeptide repeat protein [Deltaproteobacteria bacterium]